MAGFRTATPRATTRATAPRKIQRVAPIDRRKVQTPTQPIRRPRNVTR